MKGAPGVAAYRGNYSSRQQRSGPELYAGPLSNYCLFFSLSTLATLIAGLTSFKTAAASGEHEQRMLNTLFVSVVSSAMYKLWVYVCVYV